MYTKGEKIVADYVGSTEKCQICTDILKMRLRGFAVGLDIECKKNRGLKQNSNDLFLATR